jgi:hypothetical protein
MAGPLVGFPEYALSRIGEGVGASRPTALAQDRVVVERRQGDRAISIVTSGGPS